jgi:hypothetical protein
VEITATENLAGALAQAVASSDPIQTKDQATAIARSLAIIEMGVADELRLQLKAWTLQNGPVVIDASGDQAYGHWEKKTTAVGDESGLFALLASAGLDITHYQRANLSVIKGLLSGDDLIEGIEQFVSTTSSYVFGFKHNLRTKPRKSASTPTSAPDSGVASIPLYRLGPQGVVSRARVVTYTPADLPAAPALPVMPPSRLAPTK